MTRKTLDAILVILIFLLSFIGIAGIAVAAVNGKEIDEYMEDLTGKH